MVKISLCAVACAIIFPALTGCGDLTRTNPPDRAARIHLPPRQRRLPGAMGRLYSVYLGNSQLERAQLERAQLERAVSRLPAISSLPNPLPEGVMP